MSDEQRARVESSMADFVKEVDKLYLRGLQAAMHKCAARCCEDKVSSIESVHACVENCGVTLQKAQSFVQTEFERMQNRLQRCIMTCNDNIRDKMGPQPPESEISKYTKEFEGCAKSCVDNHIELIPTVMKRMKEVLNAREFQVQ